MNNHHKPRRRGVPRYLLRPILAAALAFLTTFGAKPADAHELRPTIVTMEIEPLGKFDLRINLNLEAFITGIGAEHSDTAESENAPRYDRLRSLAPAQLRQEFSTRQQNVISGVAAIFDGSSVPLRLTHVGVPEVGDTKFARHSTIILSGNIPTNAQSFTLAVAARFGNTVVRVTSVAQTGPLFAAYLKPGQTSDAVSLQGVVQRDFIADFARYTLIGFEHILPKGLDHILFVVGLFLLSPRFRPLAWQITGFTLAHTVTLALGIMGFINIPPAIVEPLIAASIIFVAVENLFTDKLHRWRPVAVFAFGLLHGLGFAGVLNEIGLPPGQFVSSLIAFNVGVELGQLTVIAFCFVAVGFWFRHRHWYRHAITMPASIAIAVVAAYWFVERIA